MTDIGYTFEDFRQETDYRRKAYMMLANLREYDMEVHYKAADNLSTEELYVQAWSQNQVVSNWFATYEDASVTVLMGAYEMWILLITGYHAGGVTTETIWAVGAWLVGLARPHYPHIECYLGNECLHGDEDNEDWQMGGEDE